MIFKHPRFRVVGDTGALVQLGDGINRETNLRVHCLVDVIESSAFPGLIEVIPAYNSLLVNYNPAICSYDSVVRFIESVESGLESGIPRKPRLVEIPVLYDEEFGPDLEYVARLNSLSVNEVVDIHTSGEYLVYMLGFTPGFAFLGGMSDRIRAPRLDTPREKVKAGSVGIAGSQTGIYPIESAGGWRLIGRTPTVVFKPDRADPFLYRAGDLVRFRPVTRSEFDHLSGLNG